MTTIRVIKTIHPRHYERKSTTANVCEDNEEHSTPCGPQREGHVAKAPQMHFGCIIMTLLAYAKKVQYSCGEEMAIS